MFKNIQNFDPNTPKGRFGFTNFRWSTLFVLDFLFGLSNKKDDQGDLIKRYENPRFPGNWFRNIHESLTKKLLQNNKDSYEGTLLLPTIEKEDFTKDFFQLWDKEVNMPIVVKGYLSEAAVVQETTIESLVKNHGEKEVTFVTKKSEDKNKNRVGQNVEVASSTLREYLTDDRYKQNYVNNFYGVLNDEDYREKSRGEEIDDIRNQRSFISQWFISRTKTSGSALHCASGDNMFLNLHGNKEWFFIDPSYMPLLKPALSKYGIYCISELQEQLGIEEDFYEELIKDYPYFKHVPVFRQVLDPGDLLFNPSNWWHSVRNHSDYTVGCAVRYKASKPSLNSWTIFTCLILDMVKHPLRSNLSQAIRLSMDSKKARKGLINSIFSSLDKKPKKAPAS